MLTFDNFNNRDNPKIIPARVKTIIQLSKINDFLKFEVTMNEIPIGHYFGKNDPNFY